jgi:redox-sensitive bicupin YhaK (pirin superfamily)
MKVAVIGTGVIGAAVARPDATWARGGDNDARPCHDRLTVSNLDANPAEQDCRAQHSPGPVTELYEAREVPLGGVRGVHVMRLLPQRVLPTVGAWCFLDHFGPDAEPGSIHPHPHPHTGLQTVTWPFEGRIRHRDSLGSDVVVQTGQLNIMTAGHGIAHSEFVVPQSPSRHGLQLWTALPAAHADTAPHFEQHTDLPLYELPGLRATVIIGTLAAVTSPATAYTPIVGADLVIDPGAQATVPLPRHHEHALVLIDGDLLAAGTELKPGPLLYLGTGRTQVSLRSEHGAHAILLGGEPFDEDIVMWWNFVGRSHTDIVQARGDWEDRNSDRFPAIPGHSPDDRIPAPPLPAIRLKPRGRRH